MIAWFATIAVLGIAWIVRAPAVLAAFDPRHAVGFFAANGFTGFAVLGAVFLVVTGGEALYADMGHFGRRPIRLAWFAIVLPALVLNYLGQGALMLRDPRRRAPVLRAGAVLGATAARRPGDRRGGHRVAGADLRSVLDHPPGGPARPRAAPRRGAHVGARNGADLRAAGELGADGRHRTASSIGFGSSSALAAAYGIAVALTMVITVLLLYVVETERWRWPRPVAVAALVFFLTSIWRSSAPTPSS